MKKAYLITASFVTLSLLSGCMIVVDGDKRSSSSSRPSFEQREEDNRAAISKLSIGTSPNDVIRVMGTPDFDEQLRRDDTQYRVLYYRTQRVKADGITTKDECTPLVFANGELLGWGNTKLAMVENTSE